MTKRPLILATTALALAMGLGACKTVSRVTNLDIGKSVASMDAPRIEATSFVAGSVPPRTGALSPPKTFFLADPSIDPRDNYVLAERNKAVIDDAGQVVPDTRIRQYLHSLADKLLAAGPQVAILPLQFHILPSPIYNASAQPTGDLYITIGALNQIGSEDELAILMAHEISHILLAHHDRDRLFEQQRNVTQGVVEAAVIGGAIAASSRSGSLTNGGITPAEITAAQEENTSLQMARLGVDFIGNDVVSASWSRANEDEADQLGLDVAVRAGYDPNEIYNMYDRMEIAADTRKTRMEQLDQNAAQYTDQLETLVASGDFSVDAIIKTGIDLGTLVGKSVLRDTQSYLSRSHADTSARRDRSEGYIDRFYVDANPDGTAPDFTTTKSSLGIPQLFAAYTQVDVARGQVEEKQYDAALATLSQASLQAPIGSHPFPRVVEAYAREGKGDISGAIAALNGVSYGAPLPLHAMLKLANLQVANNDGNGALATLRRAEDAYGAEAVQPERVAIALALGRTDEMQAALAKCADLSSETQRRCRGFAQGNEGGGNRSGLLSFLDGALPGTGSATPSATPTATPAVAAPATGTVPVIPPGATAPTTEPTGGFFGALDRIGGGLDSLLKQ